MHTDRPAMVKLADSVLRQAREGNSDALGALWREFQPSLLRYLRGKRVVAPQDVASQVWIDVSGSLARFEGDEDDFRKWLFTIAHRRSVDEVRRAVRKPETLEADAGVDEVAAGADSELDQSLALDRAIAMVQRLPPDMGEAVMLRVVSDMPFADIAAVMSRTEGDVRVLVHRGLKKLSELLVTESTTRTMQQVS